MKFSTTNGYKWARKLIIILGIISIIFIFGVPRQQREPVQYNQESIKTDLSFFDDSAKHLGYVIIYCPSYTNIEVFHDGTQLTVWPSSEQNRLYKISLTGLNGTYLFKGIRDNSELFNYESRVEGLTPDCLVHSNTLVDFKTNDELYKKAQYFYKMTKDDFEFAKHVTRFVYTYIAYSKKNLVEKDYIPDVHQIYKRKYGVCTDYAVVECALLKLQNIPCKVVYGMYKKDLHAWCEAYINDQWIILDPSHNTINGQGYKKQFEY